MAGTASVEPVSRGYMNGISSSHHHCQSGEEALAALRSSGQVENGTPSISPPYWDSDEDDDGGQKPSELYGKHTWNIEKFSQINKRELKSEEFDAGGYKWYILIYPQGCDVCNHLSLFLCVANHDKLLPGWSHFAQFTIMVENKDPNKSKFSDTLHRFWKKEHDWGWKKFMELSKVLDGFIDADTLTIKAKVQVIRERADRLFRCLDCEYRRELVKVYLTNVEQICRRFVEERRCKLGKLIDDKARWPSFCSFWLGIDQNARRRMSREKTDAVLRVVIKHFFVEKEVTSTLVMDSLYSGLKALKGYTKGKKVRENFLDAVEFPAPIVRMEKDMFVLVDDVLLLLERAATEPLPPKDDKGPQSRMKDGGSAEDLNRSIIERDERRLTELGRRTIEIFVLAHIFSKIEVAYQEAVALKRQEELIREEEAAWIAETELKARRGGAEKEKKSKKKQGKQKKSSRKGKDKVKDDKAVAAPELQQETQSDEGKDCIIQGANAAHEKPDMVDDASDGSDSVNCLPEVLQADSEDSASPVNWETDKPEVLSQRESSDCGVIGLSNVESTMNNNNIPPALDDGSSTCSSDSVQSVVTGGTYKGISPPYRQSQKATRRGRNQYSGETNVVTDTAVEEHPQPSEHMEDVVQPSEAYRSQTTVPDPVVADPLKDLMKDREQHLLKKEELSLEKEPTSEEHQKEKAIGLPSSSSSPTNDVTSAVQVNLVISNTDAVAVTVDVTDPVSAQQSSDRISPVIYTSTSNSDTLKAVASKSTDKSSVQHLPVLSRPLSAPLIPGAMSSSPVVSMVPTAPLLARSMSAVGWLGPDPAGPVSHSFTPQTSAYRNAIVGPCVVPGPSGFSQPHPPSSVASPPRFAHHPNMMVSGPMFIPQSSERLAEPNSASSNHHLSFGVVNNDRLQNGTQWMNNQPTRDSSRSMCYDPSSINDDIRNIDFCNATINSRSRDHFPSDFPACTSGRQTDRALTDDDFPHLGIINDLLDDGYGVAMAARASTSYQNFSNGPLQFTRQFTFPGDVVGMSNDTGPATTSCRFERTRSNGFHRGYDSIGGHPVLDMMQQTNPMPYSNTPYSNGQIDALTTSQWHMGGSDLSSLLTMNNLEGDGYPYHIPDYLNMPSSVNGGYTVLRPSGGHR